MVMGMNQYAVFRSSDNFKFSESFIPERWLDDERFKDDKKDALQPFSFGPRNCIGRKYVHQPLLLRRTRAKVFGGSLAYVEMRLIMAKLLFSFDLSLRKDCHDWTNQKIYTVWEKAPLMVHLTPVNGHCL
jgi:cytochrome P450